VDAAKHPEIVKFLVLGPHYQIVWTGKVPVMRYVADWPHDFKEGVNFTGATGGQMFASNDYHFVWRSMARPMNDEVNACDGGQLARPKLPILRGGVHRNLDLL